MGAFIITAAILIVIVSAVIFIAFKSKKPSKTNLKGLSTKSRPISDFASELNKFPDRSGAINFHKMCLQKAMVLGNIDLANLSFAKLVESVRQQNINLHGQLDNDLIQLKDIYDSFRNEYGLRYPKAFLPSRKTSEKSLNKKGSVEQDNHVDEQAETLFQEQDIKGIKKVEYPMSLEFANDEKVAELLRQATAFKDKKQLDSAIATLAEAKKLMLISPVAYTTETWCKYPLYLQQAGKYEESMAEFQFLLDDLNRRAHRDSRLDDPSVGPKKQKLAYYRIIMLHDSRLIKEKRALAQSREVKKNNTNVKKP